jgi:hypothetical protein
MRVLFITIVALVGCTKTDPLFCEKNPDDSSCRKDGGSGDGGIDMSPFDADLTWGTGDYAVLLPSPGPATLTLNSFSTSGGNPCISAQAWVNTNQPDSCFVIAGDITIQDATITGTRPLVVVATGTLTIKGKLDIASHNTGGVLTNGPGVAGPPSGGCAGTAPEANSGGSGGGAGGSFKTKGGNGGTGDGGAAQVPAGGVAANTMPTPTLLRAGCSGQTSGAGTGAGALGGGGGGAMYLLAGTKIDLSAAVINASGAGGAAGSGKAGGGGGGSGGMIVLYVDSTMGTITTTAATRIVANGGGGGGGGASGADPDVTMATTGAMGAGVSGGCNTNGGGNGGFSSTNGGNGGPGCNGGGGTMGGGGGGGVGYFQSSLILGQGAFSPQPVIP